MPDLNDLYILRHQLGLDRQRRHARALRGLDSTIRQSIKRSKRTWGSAYDYNRTMLGDLMDQPSYKDGSRGYIRKIRGHEEIFRLVGAAHLARDSGINWFAHVARNRPARELYKYLKSQLSSPDEWLPLSRFADGSLSGRRNFAFWTTHRLDQGDIIENAHHIGLPNNWLKRWSVLLRCRVDSLEKHNKVHVPTVLDAYTSVVFHPTEDISKPGYGVTIKLSGAGALSRGTEEYVIGPIEAEKLYLRPIYVDFWKDPYVSAMRPDVWERLEAYYSSLMTPPAPRP